MKAKKRTSVLDDKLRFFRKTILEWGENDYEGMMGIAVAGLLALESELRPEYYVLFVVKEGILSGYMPAYIQKIFRFEVESFKKCQPVNGKLVPLETFPYCKDNHFSELLLGNFHPLALFCLADRGDAHFFDEIENYLGVLYQTNIFW